MSLVGKVKTTRITGNKISDDLFFEAVFDSKPTDADICEAQIKAGYHPGGYGSPRQIRIKEVGDCFTSTWCCHANCD